MRSQPEQLQKMVKSNILVTCFSVFMVMVAMMAMMVIVGVMTVPRFLRFGHVLVADDEARLFIVSPQQALHRYIFVLKQFVIIFSLS
jgi:hypothetical protein